MTGSGTDEDRYCRQTELLKIVGLSAATIRRMEREGKFPRRRKIGQRSIGWLLSEVREWSNGRAAVLSPALEERAS